MSQQYQKQKLKWIEKGRQEEREKFKKKIDEWNYLGTARDEIYKKGKRMSFKDTKKKIYRIGKNDLKKLKIQLFGVGK